MKVDEARGCDQSFFNRLFVFYQEELQSEMPNHWPMESQIFAAGLVGYGAEVGQAETPLSGQDRYFVDHWCDNGGDGGR